MFAASDVSNKMLVFNIMAAKTFIFPGVTQKLDSNHGLPPEKVVTNFQNTIKRIKGINSYHVLMQAISYHHIIKNSGDIVDLLSRVVVFSQRQVYTK